MSPKWKSGPLCRVVLPLVFWLTLWELASLWVGKELLLPGPLVVLRTLWELALTAAFWQTAGASLLRVFAGFAAGAALGAALAACTAAWGWADALLSPVIRIIRATPVASFIILVLLWVRTDLTPAVISGLMALPVVWANVHRGAAETDPALLELAAACRFDRGKTLRLVYIPSVLPYFASGCTTALGLAWKAGVAAEVLCQPKWAIGAQVYYSKIYLETPSLFAWTAVVLILSLALERALNALLDKLKGGAVWK